MHTDNTAQIEETIDEPYTFSLFFKELGLLSLILFLGFTGFSLCIEKIYSISGPEKIEQITVHDAAISEATIEEASGIWIIL